MMQRYDCPKPIMSHSEGGYWVEYPEILALQDQLKTEKERAEVAEAEVRFFKLHSAPPRVETSERSSLCSRLLEIKALQEQLKSLEGKNKRLSTEAAYGRSSANDSLREALRNLQGQCITTTTLLQSRP